MEKTTNKKQNSSNKDWEQYQLTLEQFNLLPDKIYRKIKGRFILEIDGHTYYGFYSAEDVYNSLRRQKTEIYKKHY